MAHLRRPVTGRAFSSWSPQIARKILQTSSSYSWCTAVGSKKKQALSPPRLRLYALPLVLTCPRPVCCLGGRAGSDEWKCASDMSQITFLVGDGDRPHTHRETTNGAAWDGSCRP